MKQLLLFLLILTHSIWAANATNGSMTVTACDSFQWNNATYTTSGKYYSGSPANEILNLTILNSTYATVIVSSYFSYTWPLNNNFYTSSGSYTEILANSNGCDSIVTLELTIYPGIHISPIVFLTGAYDPGTGLMYDSLRVNNLIPLTEPYSAPPYYKPQIGGPGGESVSYLTLGVTGNNAIVDWIFVELRSNVHSSTIIATKRGLLQRDGDIVDADGISPLFFEGIEGGTFYVSVKHRNHLGIMTASPVTLEYNSTDVDFTSPAFLVYENLSISNSPRKIQGSVATMLACDANSNKNTRYNGFNNDKEAVLQSVGYSTPNNTLHAYRTEDLNMDGKVRYNNFNNDRYYIGLNIGMSNLNAVLSQHTPN